MTTAQIGKSDVRASPGKRVVAWLGIGTRRRSVPQRDPFAVVASRP